MLSSARELDKLIESKNEEKKEMVGVQNNPKK